MSSETPIYYIEAKKEDGSVVTTTLDTILSNTLDKIHLDIFDLTGETVDLAPPIHIEGLPRFILLFSEWSTTSNTELKEKLPRYVQENIYFYKPKID